MSVDIRAAITRDRLEDAALALAALVGTGDAELANEVIAHQASLRSTATKLRRGTIDDADAERARTRVRFALLDILDGIERRGAASPQDPGTPLAAARQPASPTIVPEAAQAPLQADVGAPPAPASVFLSYNHDDAPVAARVRAALEAGGVRVRIDSDAMAPGEDIGAFIARSVRDTGATVCLVSNRSLASGWVAAETVQAFDAERFGASRRFIACYLDDDFFRPAYRLERTRDIDARIAAIDALLPEYAAARLDTEDLNREKSRLFALRNDLGRILARLRDSLTLDLRGERFETAMQRLLALLVDGVPAPPGR
jgi:TIR domain/Effector-associated domain 11